MLTRHGLPLLFGLAAVAFGQPTISPPSIKLGAVLGSRTPATFTATLNYNAAVSSGQETSTLIHYATSPANCLKVTVSRTTPPAQLDISADPTSLPEGTHSAQIVVNVGQYSSAGLATVTFVVGPGSSPAGLAVSPSALTFVLKTSTDPQTLTVANTPGIGGTIPFAATTSSHSWLSVSQSGTSSPASERVQVLPSACPPGFIRGPSYSLLQREGTRWRVSR